jgi:hypothetical protein
LGSDIDGSVQSFALSSLPANGTLYTDAALTTPARAHGCEPVMGHAGSSAHRERGGQRPISICKPIAPMAPERNAGVTRRPDRDMSLESHQRVTRVSGDRPTRVVLFCGGPTLARDVKEFICRLEDHPDIELLAVICQSRAQTALEVVRDLVRRRGLLAGPLLLALVAGAGARLLAHPGRELGLNRRMRRLSGRLNIVPDIHAEEVLDQVRSLAPTLGLIYGAPILKPCLFEIPKLGTLGIHHGRIPDYRGKKTTFWAMYHGEPMVTVTIQKVTAQLDSGEIVKEGHVETGRMSYGQVTRRLERLGLDLYIDGILEVGKGAARSVRRTGANRKLWRDPKARDLLTFYWRYLTRWVSMLPRS